MTELAEAQGGLPDSILESGETIVRMAELNELHDLELDFDSMLVRKIRGVWQPVQAP